MAYKPPGFSVHGIFQARMLQWAAVSYPGAGILLPYPGIKLLFLLYLMYWQADNLPLHHLESPLFSLYISIHGKGKFYGTLYQICIITNVVSL